MSAVPFERGASWASRSDWDGASLEILATTLDRWQLTAGDPLAGGVSALVIAVTQADGSPAVLKLGFPHEEGVGEALGLEAYGPVLAPRVLRQDAWTWALLLERIQPGDSILHTDLALDDAFRAACALHSALAARPAPAGLPTLARAMSDYATGCRGRLPRQRAALEALGVAELVHTALAELEALAADPVSAVLLHGDFNPNNILRSNGPGGWRVIDPKPLVGDPAYDLWPLIAQLGDTPLAERIGLAARFSGLDERRLARWGFARTGLDVSWALEDGLDAEAQATALREWSALAHP